MKNNAKHNYVNNDDCIFCKIIRRELPSEIVYEDKDTMAIKDISGDFKDHILVIPKRHCDNILDASNCKLTSCIKSVSAVSNMLLKNGYDGVNLVNNSGIAAGQTVMHLHIHIIPRKNNDGYVIKV